MQPEIKGYDSLGLITENEFYVYYRSTKSDTNQNVIIKMPRLTLSSEEKIKISARLSYEYEILKNMSIESVPYALALQDYEHVKALILLSESGVTLSRYIKDNKLSIEKVLAIAIQVINVIGKIHEVGIIHKDIKPDNILIDPNTEKIVIIDFGLAQKISLQVEMKEYEYEGSVYYMAPEQTGRINRGVEYRADYYSFGATLYELFSGQKLFEDEEPTELIKAHLSIKPKPLNEVNPQVPFVLNNIIMKLLAKSPEDRYQSCHAIREDLTKCLSMIKEGNFQYFDIALHDVPEQFILSQKLYGREKYVKQLTAIFENPDRYNVRCILISGNAGEGKTSLVNEVKHKISQKSGIFCEGKFNELQRADSFSGWSSAIGSLIDKIKLDPELSQQWESDIKSNSGLNIGLLSQSIERIREVFGGENADRAISSDDATNSFNYAFYEFLRTTVKYAKLIYLFLDDIQWASINSIKLIEFLTTKLTVDNFVIVGAYRREDLSNIHPLQQLIDVLEAHKKAFISMPLVPLDENAITEWLSDSLYRSNEDVRNLAKKCLEKTGGNPFYFTQFIKSLCADKLIYFNYQQGRWQWDMSKIDTEIATANVLDLMKTKIAKYDSATLKILYTGSCIGMEFDSDTLSKVIELPIAKVNQGLITLIDDSVLIGINAYTKYILFDNTINVSIKFPHDKIREIYYNAMPEEERMQTHLKIARFYSRMMPEEEDHDRVFKIMDQYAMCLPLVDGSEERNKVIKLCIFSGKIALLSSAYQSALDYLNYAHQLFDESRWKTHYAESLKLFIFSSQAAFSSGRFIELKKYTSECIKNSKNIMDTHVIYEILVSYYVQEDDYETAESIGREFLVKMKQPLPVSPSPLYAFSHLFYLKAIFFFIKDEAVLKLPILTDPKQVAIVDMLGRMGPCVYASKPFLTPILTYRAVMITLKNGINSVTVTAMSSLAFFFMGIGDYKFALRIRNLILKISNLSNVKVVNGVCTFFINAFIDPWMFDMRECMDRLRKNFHQTMEEGSIEFAGYSIVYLYILKFLHGDKFSEFEADIYDFYNKLKYLENIAQLTVISTTICNIRSMMSKPPLEMKMAYHNETGKALAKVLDMMHCYLIDDFSDSERLANEINTNAIFGNVTNILRIFYHTLLLCKLYRVEDDVKNKSRTMKKIKKYIREFKKFSDACPGNFLQKFYLMNAEYCAINNKTYEAECYYEKCIQFASQQKNYLDEALAYELTALFHLENKNISLFKYYLNEACEYYRYLDFNKKISILQSKYPEAISSNVSIQTQSLHTSLTYAELAKLSKVIDYDNMLKISNAIANEIDLGKLIVQLLNAVVDQVPTTECYLLLMKNDKLCIVGEYHEQKNDITVLHDLPIEDASDLPIEFIQYSQQQQKTLNYNTSSTNFPNKVIAAFIAKQVKSALCSPIIFQGELVGLLYCANHELNQAYAENHLEFLQLITKQSAIAIQNARLYYAIERFIPKRLMRLLNRKSLSELELGDSRLINITSLFSDMRDFTKLSEKYPSDVVFKFLNKYLSVVEPIVSKHHGFIDKYIGDAYLALFPDEPDHALEATIAINEELKLFRQELTKQNIHIPIKQGIGINIGNTILGVIGTKDRQEGTVIGDSVNTASRLESLTKYYNTSVLLSGEYVRALKFPQKFHFRLIDRVQVSGKSHVNDIYELLDGQDDMDLKINSLGDFKIAWNLYQGGSFKDAADKFQMLVDFNPQDTVAKLLLDRCQQYVRCPKSDWAGVTVFLSK